MLIEGSRHWVLRQLLPVWLAVNLAKPDRPCKTKFVNLIMLKVNVGRLGKAARGRSELEESRRTNPDQTMKERVVGRNRTMHHLAGANRRKKNQILLSLPSPKTSPSTLAQISTHFSPLLRSSLLHRRPLPKSLRPCLRRRKLLLPSLPRLFRLSSRPFVSNMHYSVKLVTIPG